MLKDDKWCFACGSQNPHGLQMSDFDFDGETYTARWRPSKFHQGWADILHGGIVAAVGGVLGFQASGGDLKDLTDMNKLKGAFDGGSNASDDMPPPPPPPAGDA